MVRPALSHAPPSLWAEAYDWACYVTKRLPHYAVDGIVRFEALYNDKRSIGQLQPFNSKCYAHLDEEERTSGSKLEAESIEGPLVD